MKSKMTNGILVHGDIDGPCEMNAWSSWQGKHRANISCCGECGSPFLTLWLADREGGRLGCNHTMNQCAQCAQKLDRLYAIAVGRHKAAHAVLGTVCSKRLPLAFGGTGDCLDPALLVKRMQGRQSTPWLDKRLDDALSATKG